MSTVDKANQLLGEVQNSIYLPLLFAVVIIGFAVMSSIYLYHWRKYSMNPRVEHIAKILYFGVAAFLVLGALVSLIAL